MYTEAKLLVVHEKFGKILNKFFSLSAEIELHKMQFTIMPASLVDKIGFYVQIKLHRILILLAEI